MQKTSNNFYPHRAPRKCCCCCVCVSVGIAKNSLIESIFDAQFTIFGESLV